MDSGRRGHALGGNPGHFRTHALRADEQGSAGRVAAGWGSLTASASHLAECRKRPRSVSRQAGAERLYGHSHQTHLAYSTALTRTKPMWVRSCSTTSSGLPIARPCGLARTFRPSGISAKRFLICPILTAKLTFSGRSSL